MRETAQTPMPLLTPDQREQLLANGRQPGRDHVPVVKFFNPIGIGTWLATEIDSDGDKLFGLAQLNDAPELGSFSLEELATLSPAVRYAYRARHLLHRRVPALRLCRSRA